MHLLFPKVIRRGFESFKMHAKTGLIEIGHYVGSSGHACIICEEEGNYYIKSKLQRQKMSAFRVAMLVSG